MNTPESNKSSSEATAKVKCQECGFLAWRNMHTREMIEVDHDYREKPDMSPTVLSAKFEGLPICYLSAQNIRKELPANNPGSPSSVLEVISKGRTCESYAEWKPGLSPKEHLQMRLLEETRKREDDRDRAQRDWQMKMEVELRELEMKLHRQRDQEQREWQKAQDVESRKNQAELAQVDHKRHVQILRITLIGIGLATFAAFATALMQIFGDSIRRYISSS